MLLVGIMRYYVLPLAIRCYSGLLLLLGVSICYCMLLCVSTRY